MNYKNLKLAVEERVEDLLSSMTIEEKIGQMIQLFGWEVYQHDNGEITLTDAFKEEMKTWGIGSLYGTLRADPWTGVTLATGLSPKQGAQAVRSAISRCITGSTCLPASFQWRLSGGRFPIRC